MGTDVIAGHPSTPVIVSATANDDGYTTFEAWEERSQPGMAHTSTRFIDGIEYGRVGSRIYGPVTSPEDRNGRFQRRQDEYAEAYAIIRDHVSYVDQLDAEEDMGRIRVWTADIP